MKIVRIEEENTGIIYYGALQPDGSIVRLEGNIFDQPVASETPLRGRLLAPILPSAILCIDLNYQKHAEETRSALPVFPMLFLKAPGSVVGPDVPIQLPRHLRSDKVDYEAELAVVIGKTCKNVSKENALDYVMGYTCANDVSARDWQKEWGGGQFCRAKSFDTFCPLGPCVVTSDEIPDPASLGIRTIVSGETLQDSSTADMIFDVPTLIEFLSGSTTLHPGTVILTGTPEGVGMGRKPYRWLLAGDSVSVEIDGIGRITNPVIEEL